MCLFLYYNLLLVYYRPTAVISLLKSFIQYIIFNQLLKITKKDDVQIFKKKNEFNITVNKLIRYHEFTLEAKMLNYDICLKGFFSLRFGQRMNSTKYRIRRNFEQYHNIVCFVNFETSHSLSKVWKLTPEIGSTKL